MNKQTTDLENFILAFPYKQCLRWDNLNFSNKISIEFFIENINLFEKYLGNKWDGLKLIKNRKLEPALWNYKITGNPNFEMKYLNQIEDKYIDYSALSSNININVFDVINFPDLPWHLNCFASNPNFISLFFNGEIETIIPKLKNLLADHTDLADTLLEFAYSSIEDEIDRIFNDYNDILFKNYTLMGGIYIDNTNIDWLIFENEHNLKETKRRNKIIRKFKNNINYNLLRSVVYISRFDNILLISWCLKFLGKDFIKYLKKIKNNCGRLFHISQIITGYFHQDSVDSCFQNTNKINLIAELKESFDLPPNINKKNIFKHGGIHFIESWNEICKLNNLSIN